MPPAPFAHLSLHTEYSLLDSLVRIAALVDAVRARGMAAVAVTDAGNLFALVKFYAAALAGGIKPIVGADLVVRGAGAEHRAILLCQNEQGYRNLNRLLTRAYVEGQRAGRPGIAFEWLDGCSDGLIALSGGRAGEIGQALLAGDDARAQAALARWQALFPDRLYLELTRTGRADEESCVGASVALAAAQRVPVVATNDVRFLDPADFEAHEARVCIHDGRLLSDPRRPRAYSEQQYLRSAAEMQLLFADLPEAIENAGAIAQRCNLVLPLGRTLLPEFPTPRGEDAAAHLHARARAGLDAWLARAAAGARAEEYHARLARELDVIARMGFAGYFLIVADFIAWARENGVPVGPGRGSGAGSLVAFALRITEIDPIANDLLFERFLNPERVSMPDFDIDFCMDGRDRVIEYVAQRYGRDRVAQIITHGTLAARAVVRDVGRVLGLSYGFVDSVAKLVPFELDMTLEKALAREPELARRAHQEDEVRTLLTLARALEGLARNAGRHAGGVVIAPAPLTDFMPLFCEPGGGSPVTQLDKDDVEKLGLVKFDFLGLRTLTIIAWALAMARARGEVAADFDIAALPFDDAPTYALLRRCETTAVFQLESRGMRDLVRRLQPDRFEDLVALVALYRPGPLQSGMVDDFIARKHGRARVDYLEPRLEGVLRPTYGVILYQEQVMQIAQVLAGYSLGQADLLRRAMGKKKPEEMAAQRDAFVTGARARGVPERRAGEIFDLMEKFAGYGFNKSHSAAYALLTYQTAWLKAHHPAAFMAAVLSADMDHTDKIVPLIEECRRMGLVLHPPDVNRSAHAFGVDDGGGLLYGLGAVKGVGASAVEALIEAREAGGAFRSLEDLCLRLDPRRTGRRVLEALIRAGACDGLERNRAGALVRLPVALAGAGQAQRNAGAGQVDLFGGGAVTPPASAADAPEWTDAERLAAEREALGLYLSGHPIAPYRAELEELTDVALASLAQAEGRRVCIAGLLVGMRVRAKARRTHFLTFDDGRARVEVTVFERLHEQCRDLLARDSVLVVEGEVSADEYTGGHKLIAERIEALPAARERRGAVLQVVLARDVPAGALDTLRDLLAAYAGGGVPVWLRCGARARGWFVLGPVHRVRPEDALVQRLAMLPGIEAVRFRYGMPAAAAAGMSARAAAA